jgi:adhesin/invasin
MRQATWAQNTGVAGGEHGHSRGLYRRALGVLASFSLVLVSVVPVSLVLSSRAASAAEPLACQGTSTRAGVTWTANSPTLTATTGTFLASDVGSSVAGGTGLPLGALITNVTTDGASATINAPTTAAQTTAVSLTLTKTLQNCAPANVQFQPQGTYYPSVGGLGPTGIPLSNWNGPPNFDLGDTVVCGIGGPSSGFGASAGQYVPLASAEVHANADDPSKLGAGTTEGNYTDSEAFQFTPATALQPGDKITVGLPQPAEAYPKPGSILPSSQVFTPAPAEQTSSTVKITQEGFGGPGGTLNSVTVEVDLANRPAAAPANATVRLDAYSLDSPPALRNAPGATNASGSGTQANVNGTNSQSATVTASGNVATFTVTDNSPEGVVLAATDVTSGFGPVGISNDVTVSFINSSTNTSGTDCGSDPFGPSQTSPPSSTRAGVTWTANSLTLTATAGTFLAGDVGSAVAGGTGLPVGAVITNIAPDGASATINAPTTAAQTTAVSLTLTQISGFTYLLVYTRNLCGTDALACAQLCGSDTYCPHSVGYIVPTVAVTSSAGVETATLTVPDGFPADTASSSDLKSGTDGPIPVTVIVLDAKSPPGQGTPSNTVSAYPASAFSISTSEDPVPGYPTPFPTSFPPSTLYSPVPSFQGDASPSGLSSITTMGQPTYPVDPFTSTLTTSPGPSSTSPPTVQVGNGTNNTLTATTTLHDHFNNPINDKQVSIYQQPGTHASIAPPSTPGSPPPSSYPKTKADGTVAYSVSDSCAETVNLQSTDVSDHVTLLDGSGAMLKVPVIFTPGQASAPDQVQTPASCTPTPVKSQIAVTVPGNGPNTFNTYSAPTIAPAPADGTTKVMVNVTLGDQFGNADACHQVVLSAPPGSSNAVITPQPPGHPCLVGNGPGYTGTDGVASFNVTDGTVQQVVLNVTDVGSAIPSIWPATTSDEAQINFEAADATLSTVVANPTTAPADGQPAATVMVTVRDGAGQLEQGKNVTLVGCTNDPNTPTSRAGVTWTANSLTLTATAGTFLAGDVGSTVAGGTGLPAGAVITNVTPDGASATINAPTTAAQTTAVSLTLMPPCSPDPTTTIAPPTAATGTTTTGIEGEAIFDVGDNSPPPPPSPPTAQPTFHTVYYQASVAADGITIGHTTSVNFSRGGASLAASSATVVADGTDSSTLTFTLQDTSSPPKGIPGETVSLAANPPGATISPTTNPITDSSGHATFTVSSNSPGPVSFTATTTYTPSSTAPCVGVPTNGAQCQVTATASVTFISKPNKFTISASPSTPATVLADGVSSSQVTVTALDTNGAPIGGLPVTIQASGSAGKTPPPQVTPADAFTNSSGQATFSVTDTTAETVTVTAAYQDIGTASPTSSPASVCTPASSPCTVTFVPTEAEQSTIVASGPSRAGVTWTANSQTLTATPGTFLPSDVGSTVAGGTGLPVGAVITNVTPGGATATINAPTTAAQSTAVSLTLTNPACPTGSNACAPADGYVPVTITVTLLAGSGAGLGGHSVLLNTGSATATVSPPSNNPGAVTDNSGKVSFTIADTHPETFSVYARDANTGAIINRQPPPSGSPPGTPPQPPPPTVTFLGTEAQLSSVVANPTALPAGGPPGSPHTTTVTVTLKAPAPPSLACPETSTATNPSGHTVQLTTPSGTASISPPVPTNSGGVALFTVSDTAVETIVLTATDTSCGVTVGQTATVSFTASEGNQSSVTANPVSTPASGPAATVSVTLRDKSGSPIPSHTVIVPPVSHATVTPLAYPGFAPGMTNANGLAQFSVSDGQVETVSLAAYDGAVSVSTELDQVATVSFTANEANQSTLSATQTSLPAVGATTTVSVALRTGGGYAIAGDTVSLSAKSSTVSISPATATTDGTGVAKFTVSDPTAETVVLSALDRTTGAAVVQTLPITFFANEQNQSTATASPTFVQVRKSSTVTVTLLGPTDAPLVGHVVKLNTGSTTTSVTVLTKGGVTTSTGQIQFAVTDTAAQALSISVQDTTAGVTLYRPVAVTFTKP